MAVSKKQGCHLQRLKKKKICWKNIRRITLMVPNFDPVRPDSPLTNVFFKN